jgi:hypothetical protein
MSNRRWSSLPEATQAGRVGRDDQRVAVGLADLDGYVLPALGPPQADDAALGVEVDPVPGDQGDVVLDGE